tara:strand:+ start:10557 stop:10841 length:285 start_codon:yes stop_codon:yes gene_type:complete
VTFSTSVQAQDVNTVASSTSCGGPLVGLVSDQWNTTSLTEMKRTGCEIMTAFDKAWTFLKADFTPCHMDNCDVDAAGGRCEECGECECGCPCDK